MFCYFTFWLALVLFLTGVVTNAAETPKNCVAKHVEKAIQDLYDEFNTMDSTAGASEVKHTAAGSTIHLDDVLSAKAKFVAESLRSLATGRTCNAGDDKLANAAAMADDTVERKVRCKQVPYDIDQTRKSVDQTGTSVDQTGTPVDQTRTSAVDRFMSRCAEIALDNKAVTDRSDCTIPEATDHGMSGKTSNECPVAEQTDMMEAIERIFLELLNKLNVLKCRSHSSSTVTAAPK